MLWLMPIALCRLLCPSIREPEISEVQEVLQVQTMKINKAQQVLSDFLLFQRTFLAFNHKFEQRFGYIENEVRASGKTLEDVDLNEMERLWQEAKKVLG